MKNKIVITEADLKIAPKEKVEKMFRKALQTEEGKKAYADEMELYFFMEKLNSELKKRHMSKYALAKNAGINPYVLTRAMANIDDAKFQTLKKMANGLGKGLRLVMFDLPGNTANHKIMTKRKNERNIFAHA
jgi:DNA-binding phage protein